MVRPMVHSTKHYVQQSIGTSVPGTLTNTDVVVGVAVANKNNVSEVEEGSSVKAIYLEMWLRSAATAGASFTFIFYKTQDEAGAANATEMAALGDYVNKRNILYTTQGLLNDVDADAIAIFKGWIKIPKGKQRVALGDHFRWTLSAIGQSINFCGFQTYKEYQ